MCTNANSSEVIGRAGGRGVGGDGISRCDVSFYKERIKSLYTNKPKSFQWDL